MEDVEKDKAVIKKEVHIQIQKIGMPLMRELGGLLIFLLCFAVIVPYFLIKLKNPFVMLYYFSNLDLIANILNHWNKYFDNLYYPNPLSQYAFASSTVINFIALLGISTMVSTLAIKYKSVAYGMASATTSLLITYLLPTTLIYIMMVNMDTYFSKKFDADTANTISVAIGMIVSFLCVMIEVFLSGKYIGHLAKVYEKIHKMLFVH